MCAYLQTMAINYYIHDSNNFIYYFWVDHFNIHPGIILAMSLRGRAVLHTDSLVDLSKPIFPWANSSVQQFPWHVLPLPKVHCFTRFSSIDLTIWARSLLCFPLIYTSRGTHQAVLCMCFSFRPFFSLLFCFEKIAFVLKGFAWVVFIFRLFLSPASWKTCYFLIADSGSSVRSIP